VPTTDRPPGSTVPPTTPTGSREPHGRPSLPQTFHHDRVRPDPAGTHLKVAPGENLTNRQAPWPTGGEPPSGNQSRPPPGRARWVGMKCTALHLDPPVPPARDTAPRACQPGSDDDRHPELRGHRGDVHPPVGSKAIDSSPQPERACSGCSIVSRHRRPLISCEAARTLKDDRPSVGCKPAARIPAG
jgi:hypothetical protein